MNHHSSLMNKHSTHKNPEKTQVLISSWRTFLLMEHPSNDLQGQQLGKSAGRAWPIPHQCLLRTTAHVFGSPGQLVEHPRQKIFSRNRPRGVWVYHQHHFTHDIFVCPFLLPKARWSKQKNSGTQFRWSLLPQVWKLWNLSSLYCTCTIHTEVHKSAIFPSPSVKTASYLHSCICNIIIDK